MWRSAAVVALSARCVGCLAPLTPLKVPEAFSKGREPLVDKVVVDPAGSMGRGFYNEADWVDCYVSLGAEALGSYAIGAEEMEGEVPESLRSGALFRCSPANFERGGVRYEHVLDGDGFVLKLDFDAAGGCTYTGAFVQTAAFIAESKADGILYRSTFGTQPPGGALANAFKVKLKNSANTNVVKWGGRLLALWEAGAPHELDPATLETIGQWDFDGAGTEAMRGVSIAGAIDRRIGVGAAHTAHPHVDPHRGTLASFSWAQLPLANAMRLDFVEHDTAWVEQRRTRHVMPDCTLSPHDFSMTADYYVVFENRMTMDMAPFLLGTKSPAQTLMMDPAEPARIHLIPRDGTSDPIVLDVGPFFCIHTGVAYEREDGAIVTLTSGWDLSADAGSSEKRPFLGAWGGQAPDFQNIPPTWLFETVVDPRTRRLVSHGVLENAVGHCIEHPHVDPRREASSRGQPPPLTLFSTVSNDVGLSSPPQGYGKFDLAGRGRSAETWFPGHRTFCEEPVVVPKDAQRDPRDDEVWLLGLNYDAKRQSSRLVILDGADIAAGPVCAIPLRATIPHGLHGSFAPKNEMNE